MNIPDQYFEIILNEFKDVEKLYNDANSPYDKLYFFSASFAVINRVMNSYSNPTLTFMHQILQAVHQSLGQRLDIPKYPGTIFNNLPEETWTTLISYFSELRSAFEKKNDDKIREALAKFANLWYATSGNGYYLYLRGKLPI